MIATQTEVVSPPETDEAKAAEELMSKLPDDVRQAVAAMARTTRVRRIYRTERKAIRYEQSD